jgi:putative sugar O-methyltransferase
MNFDRDGVDALIEDMRKAPAIYRPSAFWSELTDVGLRQLEGSGFENFKRTVNMTYFNWGILGILRQQFLPVFAHWMRAPRVSVFGARFPGHRSDLIGTKGSSAVSNFQFRLPDVASYGPLSALIYRTYVAMLWEFVSRTVDRVGLLRAMHEPSLGNPFLIIYRGIETSQDLCNSVHEFYRSGASDLLGQAANIAELGGGYGRLAFVCLKALPSATYTLIDIPPALNVAQEYLSRIFPNERVFRFRPFREYEEIREEFESSRVRFLAAHQIERIPPKSIDLFVNISSLHEMTREQIRNYLLQIDRICRGHFYSKQWRVSQANVNGAVIREHEYPIPSNWEPIFHRRHPIQRMFFEALYRIAGTAQP